MITKLAKLLALQIVMLPCMFVDEVFQPKVRCLHRLHPPTLGAAPSGAFFSSNRAFQGS